MKRSSGHLLFSIRREWYLFLVAIQFLTRIPIELKAYRPEWLHQSSRYFPAVGLLVGTLSACVFWLVSLFFTPLIAAVITTVFGIKLTGAFHEDGLADTCDGLGGGLTRERTLVIMKDSRIGTYGTVGLVSALLLKVSLLANMSVMTAVIALIIAHTASRLLSISLIVLLPYGGDIEHTKAKPMAQQMSLIQWVLSSLWLIISLILAWLLHPDIFSHIFLRQWFCALILAIIALAYMYLLLKRRLNGYTGDGLGATQQLTELAIYAGLAMSLSVS